MMKAYAALLGLLAVSGVASQAQAQDKSINIGILKIAALTNSWVAQQEGMFKRRGLDVKLVEFRSGNEAISALQGGSVDVVQSTPGIAMTAIERGFDLIVIAQNEVSRSAGPDSGSLQVLKDSSINAVADLAGKRLGTSSLYSQSAIGVKRLITRAGVDLRSIQFIELPFPSHADALRSRQVDAVATVDPYTTQLLSSGVGKVISWNYVESLPAQPLGAWYVRQRFQRANAQLAERFAEAIAESIDYMNADPDRARVAVTKFTGLDPALVRDMPQVQWKHEIDLQKWQEVADMMREAGVLQKPHQARQFLAPSLLSKQGL